MKKWLKVLIGIIITIVLLFVVDIGSILIFSKPIFAIKEDNGDSVNIVYRGLFYDTYNCMEFSVAQIKPKGTKYSCSIGLVNATDIIEVVDKTKEIDDFVCAEALESFYEDKQYVYYWSCMKGSYMVVRYPNGEEILVSDALEEGIISINDLDRFDISYYKEKK